MLRKWTFVLLLGLLTSIASVYAIDEDVDFIGKIAIIDSNYNVLTYTGETDTLTPLTLDGSQTRQYQWTTWSTDGRLAYFCCEPSSAGTIIGETYISADGIVDANLVYESDTDVTIYASWSPSDCGTGCRELAVLSNNLVNGGLAIDIIEETATDVASRLLSGGPLYYLWDNSGTQLLLHRNNQQVGVFNFAQDDFTSSYDNSSGTFQTAIWSPVDNRIAYGIDGSERNLTDLILVDGDKILTLASDLEGLVSFMWSPDGTKIAYRNVDRFGYSSITVVNTFTGEIEATSEVSGAISFFWSPDSTKIAYIVLETGDQQRNAKPIVNNLQFAQNDNTPALAWYIFDLEADTNLRYSAFIPTTEMIYIMTYFEQFAPSHRIWSPDSQFIVFSGWLSSAQQQPSVYVLNTASPLNSPVAINDGVLGIWSFE